MEEVPLAETWRYQLFISVHYFTNNVSHGIHKNTGITFCLNFGSLDFKMQLPWRFICHGNMPFLHLVEVIRFALQWKIVICCISVKQASFNKVHSEILFFGMLGRPLSIFKLAKTCCVITFYMYVS